VGGGQVGRKGRLRAPSSGYRADSHAAHQADQEGHGKVTTPALVKSGPEVIPRNPEGPPDHGGSATSRCISHLSVSSGSMGPLAGLWTCWNLISRWPASGDDLVLVPPNQPYGAAIRIFLGLGGTGSPRGSARDQRASVGSGLSPSCVRVKRTCAQMAADGDTHIKELRPARLALLHHALGDGRTKRSPSEYRKINHTHTGREEW
jgi:hypothetical protein